MNYLILKFTLILTSLIGMRRFKISKIKHSLIALFADLYYNCIFVFKIVCLILSFMFLPVICYQIKSFFNSEIPIKKMLFHSFPIWKSFIYYLISLFICIYARVYLKNFERIMKKLDKGEKVWDGIYKAILYFCCYLSFILGFTYFSVCYMKKIANFQNIFFYLPNGFVNFYSYIQMLSIVFIFWAKMDSLSSDLKYLGKRNIQVLNQKCGSLGKRVCDSLYLKDSHPEIRFLKSSLIDFHTLTEETLYYYSKPISFLFIYGIVFFISDIVFTATFMDFTKNLPLILLSIPNTFIILLASDSLRMEVSSFLYVICKFNILNLKYN